MRKALRPVLWLLLILSLMAQVLPALGEGGSTRWADPAGLTRQTKLTNTWILLLKTIWQATRERRTTT